MIIKSKKLGRFVIDFWYYSAEQLPLLQKILAKTVVLRCECLPHKSGFEYVAYSEQFEEVEQGCEPPLYNPVIDTKETDEDEYEMTIKFVKVRD